MLSSEYSVCNKSSKHKTQNKNRNPSVSADAPVSQHSQKQLKHHHYFLSYDLESGLCLSTPPSTVMVIPWANTVFSSHPKQVQIIMLSRFDSGIQIAFTTFPNHILIIINQEKLLSLNLISKYFFKVWKKKVFRYAALCLGVFQTL